ncbi:hypothetical protein, partial [Bacillus sp. JJ1764]|uniref:hypothetical protein n=1 Tax=Bacillus sp. JJ1764 TaxID=3122964 RepID=UPI002FFF58AD
KIYNGIYNEESLFYYSSFYYAYRKVKGGDIEEIQRQFQKINLDVMAMLINMKSIMKNEADLGSSTDNYFFSRMENCTWAFTYVIKNELEEFYVPCLYSISNMMQTLILYCKAGKSKYSGQSQSLLTMLQGILNNFISNPKVQGILKENNQLRFF